MLNQWLLSSKIRGRPDGRDWAFWYDPAFSRGMVFQEWQVWGFEATANDYGVFSSGIRRSHAAR
jgi:hypothetical protein